MNEKIAMHCHVSEQKEPFTDFLEECVKSEAKIISITDHKTLDAYAKKIANLSKEDIEKYKDIKIIVGVELTGIYEYKNMAEQVRGVAIDMLGYNINLDKLAVFNNWVKDNYISTDTPEFQSQELDRLISVSKSMGFKADYDKLKITEEDNLAARLISNALMESDYVDYNIEHGIISELKTNPRCFFNRYCKNPESPFYIDMTQYLPKIEDVMDLIHECGGLTFMPHIAGYFNKSGNEEQIRLAWEDSKNLIEQFYNENGNKLDGIEIVHPCYLQNHEFTDYLKDFANNKNLKVCGGTDYHRPGELLCNDIEGEPITENRLEGISDWARTYSIEEIERAVNIDRGER